MTLVHSRVLLSIEKISFSSLDPKVSYKLIKPTGEQVNRVSIIYPMVVINSLRCRSRLPMLVASAKRRWYPCSVPLTDSTYFWRCVAYFPLTWLANRQWIFSQAKHGAGSNPVTRVGAPNKGFGAVSHTDLTRLQLLKMWITPSTG